LACRESMASATEWDEVLARDRSADFITAISALPECRGIQWLPATPLEGSRPFCVPSPSVGLLSATVVRAAAQVRRLGPRVDTRVVGRARE
jgi:hypothetical protein